MRPMNDEEVLCELDHVMAGYGNGARLARRIGVESAYLRGIKSCRRPVSLRVATWMGYELRWTRKNVPTSEHQDS